MNGARKPPTREMIANSRRLYTTDRIDINTVTDTITCRLVEARADLGITQKELASATGISLKTIANIESKQHIPSLLYAMRIADFFHKPVTSLFCTDSIFSVPYCVRESD